MDKDVSKKMRELTYRHDRMRDRIVEAARAVVPVLKDTGQKHSAAIFEELFFEYDALSEEMLGFTRENMAQIIGVLNPGRDK